MMKPIKNIADLEQKKPRKTWAGLKPRKEATKKERLEKARKKHKGVQEQ